MPRNPSTSTGASTATPGSGSARRAMPTGISGDASTLSTTASSAPRTRHGSTVAVLRRDPLASGHAQRGEPAVAGLLAGEVPRRACATATAPASAATSAHSASAVTMTSMLDSILRSTSDAGVISRGCASEHLPQRRGHLVDVGGATAEAQREPALVGGDRRRAPPGTRR